MWTARFSQEPADQSVVRGQRVILSCVVFNYSGIVQWTKDGLALGIGEDLRGETSYGLPRPFFHSVEHVTGIVLLLKLILISLDWSSSRATFHAASLKTREVEIL